MLTKLLKSEKTKSVGTWISNFCSSKTYIILMGLCIILSSLFSLELPIYGIVAVIVVILPALFCDDMRSTIAPLIMFYCSLSLKHNNTFTNHSVFRESSFMIPFIIIAGIIALFLIIRLIFDIINHKERFTKPKLWMGFVILGVIYLLAGVLSNTYAFKSTLIGLLEIFCLSITYFYLLVSVDWKTLDLDYVVFSMMILSFAVVIEIIGTYIITKDMVLGIGGRDQVTIGWGIHTNMGSMLAFGSVTPFYYVLKDKKPLLSTVAAVILFGATFLSQSRGPIIVAGVLFVFLTVMVFVKGTQRAKNNCLLVLIIALVFAGIGCAIFFSKIKELINKLLDALNHSNGARMDMYKTGLDLFTKNPVIGAGWYAAEGQPQFTFVFFPPRWHNTFVQCLATGGVLMLLAYGYHRFETIKLLFSKEKKIPLNNGILFVCIISLLAMSMVDCFVFDLGPGLAYGAILAAIERQNADQNTFF